MMQLFRFVNQILLLFVVILSIRNIDTAVNYKLTSVFYGNEGYSMDQVANLTSWVGKSQAVVVLFTNFCNYTMNNLFNTQLNNIWSNKSIPLMTWEFFECAGKSEPGITILIHNNTFDTYINQFGERLKTWLAGNDGIYGNGDDRRIYLRLAHEMNGNWYPWSLGSIPNDYILAWHHIHDIFSNKGLDSTRLQWVWCVNNADVGSYKAEEYYVGDNYVDWLGIDGYNFGGSQSWSSWVWPNQVFDNMIGRVRKLSSTKPLSFPEHGSTRMRPGSVSDIQSKTEWLNLLCDYLNNNQIKFASYFNIEKETDWAIFGGTHGDVIWNNLHAYTAYKDCLQSNDWIQPNITNERLITDDQFAGRF